MIDLFPEIGRNQEKSRINARPVTPCHETRIANRKQVSVSFSKIEWSDLCALEEKFSLIGRFVKEGPSLEGVRSKITGVLRLEGDIKVGFLDKRTFLLRFSQESDCRKAWLRGQVMIDGVRLWLTKWRPNWFENRDSPLALVWFQLRNLPLHLFNSHSLSRICSPMGKVVDIDSATLRKSRPNVARVRLEIDVSLPIIDKIWIEFVNENGTLNGFWQYFEAENVPRYCTCCGHLGHLVQVCRKANGTLKRPVVRPEKVGMVMGRGVSQEDDRRVGGMPADAKKAGGSGCPQSARQNAYKKTQFPSEKELASKTDDIIMEAAMGLLDEMADKVLQEDGLIVEKETREEVISELPGELKAKGIEDGDSSKKTVPYKEKKGVALTGISMKDLCNLIGSLSANRTVKLKRRPASFPQKMGKADCRPSYSDESTDSSKGLAISQDTLSSNLSLSFDTWAKNLKAKAKENHDDAMVQIVEEARQEVADFFKSALEDLGKEKYDEETEDLVQRATDIFINRMSRHAVDTDSSGSSKKKPWTRQIVIDSLQRFVDNDEAFASEIHEAVKEVNSYMHSVYDESKKKYTQESAAMSLKAMEIFWQKVEGKPAVMKRLGMGTTLGCLMIKEPKLFGGALCEWATKLG